MKRLIQNPSAAALVFAFGIVLSLLLWWLTGLVILRQERVDFESRAQVAAGLIERRLNRYVDLLYANQGLFGHFRRVSRLDFNRYVIALDLPQRFPGLQALQYIQRVRLGEKEQFETIVRTDRNVSVDGYPAFSIKPPGERSEYWVINYVEPMAGNEVAFGLDVRSREEPRRAMERARDTGDPIMTGRYRLAQEKAGGVGLVIYLPIYEIPRDKRSLQQRREELAGFVNVVFRVQDVFAGVIDNQLSGSMRFDIHDVGPTIGAPGPATRDNLIIGQANHDSHIGNMLLGGFAPGYYYQQLVPVAGRHWLIEFENGGPPVSPWLNPFALLALGAGLIISLLLYLMLRTLANSRQVAMETAQRATAELREQLSFNDQLMEALPNPVYFKDAQGRYIGCNRAFEEFTKYSKAQMIGKTPHDIAPDPVNAAKYAESDRQLLANPGVQRFEMMITNPALNQPRSVMFSKATFSDASGHVAGIVGVIIDLTDRKKAEAELKSKTDQLQAIIQSSPLAIIARDFESKIRIWNPAAERLFGWKADEVLDTGTSIVPDHLREATTALRKRAEYGELIHIEETTRLHRNGSLLDVSVTIAPVYAATGKVSGTMVVIADITRRKQAELALRKNETQLRLALESADMATWNWNLQERSLAASTGFNGLFGRPRGAVFTEYSQFKHCVFPDDWRLVQAALRNAIRKADDFRIEMRVIWPDASVRWIATKGQVIRDPEGTAVALIGVAMDTTDRKVAEQRIAHLAQHDALTGLPNRLLLKDRIAQAITRAQRNRAPLAVLFIDLDRFKNINDSLGHEAGDRLLQTVAERITSCLREADTVSRLGGDEFVIVLPEIQTGADVTTVAAKVLDLLSQAFTLNGQDVHVSASIGVALFPDDGADPDTLMRNADAAMYHAKDSGRANYQFFTQHLNVAAQQRLTIESELRRALERSEFVLTYQPVYATSDGELAGMEALLRWRHPDRGIVMPGDFIAVAEDAGLIHAIGEWVLTEAAAQVRRWELAGHQIKLSVNVSAQQLRRAAFQERLSAILAEAGADPGMLELEITESLIVEDTGEALKTLSLLSELGVRLAIDDFGTGYSGLSYLKRFPIDTVKIDQSFIRDLSVDPDDAAIVRAIIAMAKSLKLSVVAEGVETNEQLLFLRALGCDLAQGFFLGRPMPIEDADHLLRTQPQIRASAE